MAWFKVDDGFHASRKLLRIPRSVRLEAAGAWVISGSWSAHEELDGFIPEFMLEEWGITPEVAGWLVTAELWESVADGHQFTNWGEYQPTKAELEEGRKKEREKKARWRAQKAEREAARLGAAKAAGLPPPSTGDTPGTDPPVPSIPTRPDPTRPDPPSFRR